MSERRAPSPIRFGTFELDPQTGELRRGGTKLKLEGQPLQLLLCLLERGGDIVTREELRQALWPADTFVDFEHGINTAVRRVRDVLGDSADAPRFIETLPRRGYRFICPVTAAAAPPARFWCRKRVSVVLTASVVIAAVLGISSKYGWRQRSGPGASGIASLAVLPCTNLSGDPDQEYIADGLTDEMTASLSRIRDLTVKSRTSAMQHKGTALSAPEIAKRLKVEGIVECSVRRSGERIDVTVQLIDASRDAHLWARTYRRNTRDVITVQDEVASDLASEIARAILPQRDTPRSRHSAAPEAHQAYLKGRHHFLNGRMQKAAESFAQAVLLDAEYAEAYAGLAASYSLQPSEGVASPAEVFPKAMTAAMKALQIDERVGEAHAVLGWTRLVYEWDWNSAERGFRRALDLNPSDDVAHMWYGCALVWRGQFEQGLAQLRRAQDLAPAVPSLSAYVGMGLYLARQYDAAVRQFADAIDLGPELPQSHSFRGLALSAQGRHAEAIESLERAVRLARTDRGDRAVIAARLAYAYAKGGKRAQAVAVQDELRRSSGDRYVSPFSIAMIYAGLGEPAQAIDWLESGVNDDDRAVEMLFLKVDPRTDSLRADPRFQGLIRRIGF